ncbi:MAG: shikimate dehydrogenase [Eubacteriaceae bacterium]
MKISTKTNLFGVLGDPIAQSLSPDLHNGLFETYHINGLYLPIEISSENLGDLVTGIRLMDFKGFNITKPHKLEILPYLDEIDLTAKKIGAVNTVVCNCGKLKGYNTDGFGFIKSIEPKLREKKRSDLKVLILGCGGAVKAVAISLAEWGVKEIVIANRTLEKAEILVEQINRIWPGKSKAIPIEPDFLEKNIHEADVLVNGTSIGMANAPHQTPINKELLHKNLLVYDMIYNPEKTQLLCDALEKGASVENGLEMLLYQGLLAFELWTGVFPNPEIGRAYLKKGLKKDE